MKQVLLNITFLFFFLNGISQHFNFRNFTLENGLPQATVYNIFQDNKGFIWIGTQGGVAKFNGIEFLNLNQKDGLAGNHVLNICQDKNNNIWLGHRFEGFTCINNGRIVKTSTTEEKYSVISLTKWKDGVISITRSEDSTSKNIYSIYYHTYSHKIIKSYKIDFKENLQKFQIKSKNGELYIATNKGLQILGNDLKLKNIILEEEYIWDFDWDEHGLLYILTKDALKIISNDHFKKDISISDTYNQLVVCKSGEIWLNNENGALSIVNDKKQYINKKNGLPNDDINCILEDSEGNIWFGLSGTGLSQLVPANFETFDQSQGIKNDQVTSVCMDHLSRLWVSGDHSVDILEFHDNSNLSLKNVIHLSDLINIEFENVNYIFQDSRLLIWLGTDNGVFLLDSKFNIIKHFTISNGLSNNFIISIAEDHNKNIWLASLYHGITKLSLNNGEYSLKTYDKNNGLCSNNFWTVFVDSKGFVYFGSNDSGISYWNGHEFNDINKDQGLFNLRAGSITEDTQNKLWIGSIGGGIFKYNGDTCIQFSSENGLSSDNPYLVIADNIGNIWTGTNTGLDMMPITSTPDPKNKKNLFKHYGLNQGFIGIETNQNAKFIDKNGNLWFGTIKGVIQCNSKDLSEDTTPPSLHITEKKLFLRETISSSKTKFKHNENHITFNFIGLHFTNPHQVKYQYMLANFDNTWSPWSKSTSATYSYLPPGKYTFKVKAINGDQYESDIKTYEFEISPPFWNTLWFYILSFISIIIIFLIIMRLRTLKIRKDKKLLEYKVAIRTQELNTEKEKVENQKEIIELKNKNVTDSILYAKTIQESVLPKKRVLDEYFSDNFIYYNPRDIVSGDFYWFKQKKEHMIIATADCTGHGIPGAFLSMLGSELLNQIILGPEIKSAAKTIELLDIGIYNAMNKDENSISYDGIDLSICIFNKTNNNFHFSGAGRPIILLSNGKINTYNPVLCSVGDMTKRGEKPTEIDIPIKKGDRIYMFSDGYVDQFGGPKNKKFLLKRLNELILSLSNTPLKNQEKIFNDTFNTWREDNEQVDDILIMAVEI